MKKKIPRIFINNKLKINQNIFIYEKEFHYIKNVLRMQNQDRIEIFNNTNYIFFSKIIKIQKKDMQIKILEKKFKNHESDLNIHLGQVVSKNKKMDFTIQKSVELGIQNITPLLPHKNKIIDNSIQFLKNMKHWKNIIISACQQSQRNLIPRIHDLTSVKEWCQKNIKTETKIVLHPNAKLTINSLPKYTKNICILIGSEVGFSDSFIDEIIKYGFTALSLGPRILRTETASIAIISILQGKFGDLK